MKKTILIIITVFFTVLTLQAEEVIPTYIYYKDGRYYRLDKKLLKQYKDFIFKKYNEKVKEDSEKMKYVTGYVNNSIEEVLKRINNKKEYEIKGFDILLKSDTPYFVNINDLDNNPTTVYTTKALQLKIKNKKELNNYFEIVYDNVRNMIRIVTNNGNGSYLMINKTNSITKLHIKKTLKILLNDKKYKKFLYNK